MAVVISGILLVADVIFIVIVVVIIIVVIGFLGSDAILVLTIVAVVLAAIIGTTVVVVIVLAIIEFARDLLGRTFVMLGGREFRDTGQLAIPHGVQRPLPAARSTTADSYDLPVLRR